MVVTNLIGEELGTPSPARGYAYSAGLVPTLNLLNKW